MADDIQDAPADAVTPDPVVKAEAKTLLEDTSDKPAAAPADWPEDWRAKLSDGDEKTLKKLERYQSPKDVAKALRALEAKMSSGQVEKLTEDATPEQVAAWRKDNGIPEKPEGYLETLKGLVIGDDDRPVVDSFLTAMHGDNVKPDTVAKALDWYYKSQEAAIADQAAKDKEYKAKSEDALRSEWGSEYRGNVNAIRAFLDTAPPDGDGVPMIDLLMGARLSDGTALGDNPAAMKWLSRLASDANPAGFVSPGAGGSQAQSIDDEIDGIKKRMRQDRAGYDKDEKMQARFEKLLEAREKLSSRAA